MAAGLIDRPMTYQEYIALPVFPDLRLQALIKNKYKEITTDEMKRAARAYQISPEEAA